MITVKVRVKAGARKESCEEIAPGRFDIAVKDKAERNAANARVMAIIAMRFKVPVSRVRIARGHHASSKIVSIVPLE